MSVLSTYPETADIETSSAGYATRFAGPVGAWFLQVQEQASLQLLQDLPGASILEVGGGHGQVTPALLRNGHAVTVIGSDPVCRERLEPALALGARFEVGNLIDLPYPSQAFDVVLSYRLLPHVTRWPQLLHELARVARRAVILDYPEHHSVNAIAPALFGLKKGLEGNTRTFTIFRQAEIVAEFERAGFRLAGRYPEFFLPMVLHRKLGKAGFSSLVEQLCRRLGLTARWGSPVILKFCRNV